jgi:diguanylate cyclase (GGDEF)-like protein/PAS domain S-box-containing protein
MAMMFKPPVAVEAEAVWQDLFRLGSEQDPFWQRVRLAQLSFLERYLPMNIPIAILNGGIVLGSISAIVDPWVLAYWGLTQLLSILLALWQAWCKRGKPPAQSATRAEMKLALGQLFVVGSGWGLLFMQGLARADPTDAMLIVAMTMAGMGCLAFSTATWPLGSLAMSGVVTLGTIIGLFANHWGDAWMVTLVILSFVLFIARGNLLTTIAFQARMRMQERMQEQEEVVRLLLNEFEANGSEWLFEFDVSGRLTFASTRFAEALRRPVEEVVGQHWTRFMTERSASSEFLEIVRKGLPYRDLLLRVDVEGETRWWSLSGTPKIDREGRLVGYRGVGSDVTERQRSAERIAELATFDALTGLVNRRVINKELADGLESPDGVALLFVDLDRFKAVNDSLGHGAGDRLLQDVSLRLRNVVADSVGVKGLVGRLGGDEFAVVLRTARLEQAEALGEAIIARLSKPYSIGGKQAMIGASVGVAIGPHDGDSVEALMRAADLALYDVKGKGRGKVRHYDKAMHKRTEDRRSLELDLKNAQSQGQLRLAFQPVVDAIDERVVGFEALIRWRHPELGDVPPATFIPIAEEAGLIGGIGAWVLNDACRVAATWPQGIKLAVNLSPMQFDDPELADLVQRTLARWRIAPARLELELTESLFLDERPQTSETLARLHAMGVGFALDDFGTGYSSLGYLQKIAFSRIKIDRSFVQKSVAEGGESIAIIQAIIALADRLGMSTTAEGTETRAEFEAMRRLGCAQIQGYYFGRPMPAEDAARLLDRSRPLVELAELTPLHPPGFTSGDLPSPSSAIANGQWPKGAARSSRLRRAERPEPLRG